MISYSSRIGFLCTTTPSVFFCQGGRNDICTILAVKKFGSSGGTCPSTPPPPSAPTWERKKRVCKRVRVFALIYTWEGPNFGHNIKGNNWT